MVQTDVTIAAAMNQWAGGKPHRQVIAAPRRGQYGEQSPPCVHNGLSPANLFRDGAVSSNGALVVRVFPNV